MVRYETYLAFAGNSRTVGLGTHSGLKDLATILGEEGWRVCAVWPSMQGGVSGMAVLCQRPIERSVIEDAWVAPEGIIEEVHLAPDELREIEGLVDEAARGVPEVEDGN